MLLYSRNVPFHHGEIRLGESDKEFPEKSGIADLLKRERGSCLYDLFDVENDLIAIVALLGGKALHVVRLKRVGRARKSND